MTLKVTSSSTYFLLFIAFQLVSRHTCFAECVNVWDCNTHVFRATSDQDLFPFLKPAPFQPLQAPEDSAEGQQLPQQQSSNVDNPGFYDPSYGFSQESIADLITKDKDSYSIEPILIEAVPPIGTVYSNAYQNNFEQISEEEKGIKNNVRVDPANEDSDQKLEPTHPIPYKNPLTFGDALYRQVQQANKSIKREQSERSLSSFDSADYTRHFRNNFKEFPKLPVNSVNHYEDGLLKNRQFQGNKFGEEFRSFATKLEPIAPQFQGFGKKVVPDKNQDISDLLEQSRALGAYLNRLKAKAEADLLGETKHLSREQRGGRKAPPRGGRAIYRRRLPQIKFAQTHLLD